MDIFKLANQIANNISDGEKETMENMDMEKMITHVTQNVFKMMNGNGAEGGLNLNFIKEMMPKEQETIKNVNNVNNVNNVKNVNNVNNVNNFINFPKTRDICFDLNVDLQDFYTGKKKKLNVKRKRIIDVDGKQTVVEEKKKITINIEKGMKDEQQIRFEAEADQIPGYSPGDIVITLVENEHPYFQRDGDNLIYIKNINLYQSYDITFDIKHLDDRILRIQKINDDTLHLNDGIRKVKGEGMPVYNSDKSGDLFIRFNLIIPKILEPSKLKVLKELFSEENDTLETTFSKKCVLENISDTDIEDLTTDYSSSDTSSVSSVSSDSD